MKQIKPTNNEHQWPRRAVASIECRKRDLVVRISDWTRYREEPAYDVEVYVGGVYDFNLSESFPVNGSKKQARDKAAAFAAQRIAQTL
jgi:hypothetical protein